MDVVLDVILKEQSQHLSKASTSQYYTVLRRTIIMPKGMFWALWDGFEKILQHSGLSAIIYDVGKRMGEHAAKHLKEMFGLEGNDLIQAMAQAGQATGWGITEVQDVNFKGLSATIIVKDCFEAAARAFIYTLIYQILYFSFECSLTESFCYSYELI